LFRLEPAALCLGLWQWISIRRLPQLFLCSEYSCAKKNVVLLQWGGELVRLGCCVASGGRIPGADSLLATPCSASWVHSDTGEHPAVTETVGEFGTASCACHATAHVMVQLLFALSVSRLLRFDDPTL
jgi:hypothetical protein